MTTKPRRLCADGKYLLFKHELGGIRVILTTPMNLQNRQCPNARKFIPRRHAGTLTGFYKPANGDFLVEVELDEIPEWYQGVLCSEERSQIETARKQFLTHPIVLDYEEKTPRLLYDFIRILLATDGDF